MSSGVHEEEDNQDILHKRIVLKDDGRKLYSYTFGDEADPFEQSDGSLVAQVQPAPTATEASHV